MYTKTYDYDDEVICGFAHIRSHKLRNVSNVSDLSKKEERKIKGKREKKGHW